MASYMNYTSNMPDEEDMYFPEINGSYRKLSNANIGMPVKKMLTSHRINMITSNPQNHIGTAYLRDKFKLPDPNRGPKIGRQIGGPSFVSNTKPSGKITKPKRILPKKIRDDPLADGPKITEDDLSDGMMSLLNRGIIPKGVDVTPAFERGKAPFEFGAAKMYEKLDKASLKYTAPAITYKKPASVKQKFRGPNTFITADGGYDNTYFDNNQNDTNGNLFSKQELGRSQGDLMNVYEQKRSDNKLAPITDLVPAHEAPPAILDPGADENEFTQGKYIDLAKFQ